MKCGIANVRNYVIHDFKGKAPRSLYCPERLDVALGVAAPSAALNDCERSHISRILLAPARGLNYAIANVRKML